MTDHMHPINYTVYTLVLFFASELYVKYLSYESFCNYCRLYTCPSYLDMMDFSQLVFIFVLLAIGSQVYQGK